MGIKITYPYTGKKSPTNPEKQEQHKNRKTKDELIHRWENDDWKKQLKDYVYESSSK